MIEKKTLQVKTPLDKKRFRFPDPILTFVFTALLLVFIFGVFRFYPFGDFSVLQSDLAAQYAPDLIAYKNQLLKGSLQYTSLISFGKSTFGLFAYYLSSPINLISFLFPASLVSEAVLILIVIKLSLASAFMTLFLQKRHNTRSRYSIVFGLGYAFSSYAVAFMIHIMWLDGFYFLPLLLFCIEHYLEDQRRWKALVAVLALMFISGFYIAYMVGIFSFLYLIFRLIEDKRFSAEQVRKTGKTTGAFIGIAVLSAMISAIIILPAGIDILSNPDYTAKNLQFQANFTFLAFLNQLLPGSYDSLSHNNPLVYCGLFTLFLCGLFFLNPSFSKRLKIITGIAIGFFVFSFSISLLNLAWHLFDEPNWFLFRYSFLLSFIMLSVAFRSLLHIKALKGRAFLSIALIFFLLLFVVQGFGDLSKEGDRFYINLILGLIEIFCLYALTDISFHPSVANLKKLIPAFLVVMVCFELILVNPMLMRPKIFGGEMTRSFVIDPIEQATPLVLKAKNDAASQDIGFFRMETVKTYNSLDTVSAGLYMNYPSTSTFNTTANKKLNRYLKQFGYMTNYNYFASMHSYSSIVHDTLFGVRYLLSGDESGLGYETMAESADGSVTLLKNDISLPLIYEVREDAGSFDVYESEKNLDVKDPFLFQNRYLQATFGPEAFSKPVYLPVDVPEPELFNAISEAPEKKEKVSDSEEESASLEKVEDRDLLGVEDIGQTKYHETQYYRMNRKSPMKITYRFVVETEDPIYFAVVAVAGCGDTAIFVDDELIDGISESYYTTIFQIGNRKIGDTVTVELRSDVDQYAMIKTVFYSCDTKLFREQLAKADPSGAMTIDQAQDGYVKATVNTDKDALLLSTIPYEKGWTLLVDGHETEIVPYQDAFISIPVTAGPHTIELSFQAPGLVAGGVISGIGLSAFIVLSSIALLRRRKK